MEKQTSSVNIVSVTSGRRQVTIDEGNDPVQRLQPASIRRRLGDGTFPDIAASLYAGLQLTNVEQNLDNASGRSIASSNKVCDACV